MNFITIFFLGVICLIFISLILLFVLRFLKGSLKIILFSKVFNSGDELVGRVELKTRKEISSEKLIINLVALQKKSTGNNRSTWVSVYNISQIIDEKTIYKKNIKRSFDFNLKIPYNDKFRVKSLSKTGIGALDSTLKNIRNLTGDMPYLKWKLEVHLASDKGLDLYKSKNIKLNLFSNPNASKSN